MVRSVFHERTSVKGKLQQPWCLRTRGARAVAGPYGRHRPSWALTVIGRVRDEFVERVPIAYVPFPISDPSVCGTAADGSTVTPSSYQRRLWQLRLAFVIRVKRRALPRG